MTTISLSALNLEQTRVLSVTARNVRQDIRKKNVSLRSLRTMRADITNPFWADRRGRNFTAATWALIDLCIGERIEATCAALLNLEEAADLQAEKLAANPENLDAVEYWQRQQDKRRAREAQAHEAGNAPLSVGDRVNDGGAIRTITAVRGDGAIIVLDGLIETSGQGVQRVETAASVAHTEALQMAGYIGNINDIPATTYDAHDKAFILGVSQRLYPVEYAGDILAAHVDALAINAAIDADLAILRRDIENIRKQHTAEDAPIWIDYAITHVFNRIVQLHHVGISRDTFDDLKRSPEQCAFDAKPAAEEVPALDFIEDVPEELQPATDIYRRDYFELAELMQTEKAQPCGSRPTARGLLALMIVRYQAALTPEIDQQRDTLSIALITALGFGIITGREHDKIQRYIAKTERPRAMLEALRVALLRGQDIKDTMKRAK